MAICSQNQPFEERRARWHHGAASLSFTVVGLLVRPAAGMLLLLGRDRDQPTQFAPRGAVFGASLPCFGDSADRARAHPPECLEEGKVGYFCEPCVAMTFHDVLWRNIRGSITFLFCFWHYCSAPQPAAARRRRSSRSRSSPRVAIGAKQNECFCKWWRVVLSSMQITRPYSASCDAILVLCHKTLFALCE